MTHTVRTTFPQQEAGRRWSAVETDSYDEAMVWFGVATTQKSVEPRVVELIVDDRVLRRVEL
jgi:hypothetical protein